MAIINGNRSTKKEKLKLKLAAKPFKPFNSTVLGRILMKSAFSSRRLLTLSLQKIKNGSNTKKR